MEPSLSALIAKNEEKLVDRAATSLKVMFGVAYADVAQEDLEERLYRLFDAFIEITRRGAQDTALTQEVVEGVMVTPVYDGWNHRSMTEEVLQVVDMVINKLIETDLAKPEQAEDKKNSQELLALSIRTAKDVVNGQARRELERKQRTRPRWATLETPSEDEDSPQVETDELESKS